MKKKAARCVASAVLCACLMGQLPGQAVSLIDSCSAQYETALRQADRAGLLPDCLDGVAAQQQLERAQLCALAVRLYASLTDTTYETLSQEYAQRSAACPYIDTQQQDVQLAWTLGLSGAAEDGLFLPEQPATRQMVYCMLYRTMQRAGCTVTLTGNEIAETLYACDDGAAVADWARMGTAYFLREGIAEADDGIGPAETVTAEQAVLLSYRAAAGIHTGRGLCSAETVGSIATHSGNGAVSWTNSMADLYRVYFYRQDDFLSKPEYIEQVAGSGSGAQQLALDALSEQNGQWYWSVDAFNCDGSLIATASELTPLTISADAAQLADIMPEQEPETAQQPASSDADGEQIIIDTIPAGMTFAGESYGSRVARIFGDGASYHKYADSSEAASHQATVTVPVWSLDADGNKYTRMASFQVHEALASTVLQIFTEIYQGSEQFPICSLGGYSWRGDASTSEHCLGTAIDINPNENYMCTNSGTALTGTHWSPGDDPYSISPDGDVVRIFTKYGFGWGGTWNSKKDYMHFSYFGT